MKRIDFDVLMNIVDEMKISDGTNESLCAPFEAWNIDIEGFGAFMRNVLEAGTTHDLQHSNDPLTYAVALVETVHTVLAMANFAFALGYRVRLHQELSDDS